MEWISNWIQGIIVAVIISTIIEMILPEGNSKKYIKVVIGVYILFSIVSPVINKITKKDLKVSNMFDLNEYIQAYSANNYNNLNESQESQIRSIYETSLKNDMKEKISQKGYKVNDIVLEIEGDESYSIKQINLTIEKQQTDEKNNKVEIVNEVKVEIKNEQANTTNKTTSKKETVSEKEKNELKKYLSTVYEIDEKNIQIN